MFQSATKDDKQPIRKSSFWGIRCESGKKYSQIVNQKYHISMAALDPLSVKNGKEVVSLVVERDGSEFLLCNLQKDSVLQANLNLFFDKGEKVVFSLKGQGIVHLTGYLIKDDNDQNDCTLKSTEIVTPKKKLFTSPLKKGNEKFQTNITGILEGDNWKVESKEDKSPASAMKNDASSAKKSASVSPSQKTPLKKLFGAATQESEDSSDEEDDEESDDEGAQQLLRLAQKRPLDDEDDDDDEDDEDFEYDEELEDDDDNFTSEESEEEEELPVEKKPNKDFQSNKKLKADTSTPAPGKKSALRSVTEVIDIDDDSKNGDMNSSIGRTPMPKKKPESILRIVNDSKKANITKDDSSDSDSDDEMETSTVKESDKNKSTQMDTSSEAVNSEKKKRKKKKKKKAQADNSNADNESNISKNDSFTAGDGDLSKVQYSKKLQGGVEYDDIRPGNGPIAKKGRLVHVYYTGKLEDNKIFDACQPGRSKPFVFKLGAGQVIKGWDLAVEGMKVGGKRRIKIPPHMGYKNQRTGPIPPNSTLHFTVELKAVS